MSLYKIIQSIDSILVGEGHVSNIVFESHVIAKWYRKYSFENNKFPQLFSSSIFIMFLLIKKIVRVAHVIIIQC